MSDFSNVLDAGKARQKARRSLVALTLSGALACEHTSASSGEGSLEIVPVGQRPSAAHQRSRGTITVRGLHDGALQQVRTSSESGTRTLRLAPGLYSVTAATELEQQPLDSREPVELQGSTRLVRVEPGSSAIVRVRFESPDLTAFAAGSRGLTRSALDYQDVAGSVAERVRVCRPTGNGCEDASSDEPPLPERSVLDRNPL